MNNEVARQLKALVEQHGITLCNDPKRCRALLLDICGNYKKEIHVLISALENDIPGELLSSQNVPFEILRNRLVKKLTDEFALTEQGASWSIDTWAFALEIKEGLPDIAGELIDKGDLLMDQAKYKEALHFYDKAFEIDPRNVHFLNLKGICLVEIKDYYEAIRCYEIALSFDPQYVNAWVNKGWALDKLGRLEEALRCYDKALEIDPQNADALKNKHLVLPKLA